MDLAEWDMPELSCDAIEQQTHFYKSIRTHMGVYPIAQDTVTFIIKRIGGSLTLDAVYASYLPPANARTLAALDGCTPRPVRELRWALATKRYQYQYYAPLPAPSCTAAGVGTYFVRAPDEVTLDSTAALVWSEGPSGIALVKTLGATIYVAPSHATAKLVNSDANCPVEIDGVPPGNQIGFRAKLDAITGKVLESQAGTNPYCVSCLSGQ